MSAAAPAVTPRVVLLALLPKGGAPMTVAQLAQMARCSRDQVVEALLDDYLAHRVDFDVRADAFSVRRQGS